MNNLREKIEEDFKRAMKERKEREISLLRLLRVAIFDKEREKRFKIFQKNPKLTNDLLEKESQLEEEEIFSLIFSEIRKRKEAIVEFEKGKRNDLVEKEKEEIEILKKYLPQQLSKEEIEKIAREIIEKMKTKDLTTIMKELMPKIKGRAEGSFVLEIIKEILSQK